MLLNRSITTQFTIVFVAALLLVVGSFYLVLESVYRNQLKAQAETVADNVDAFGSWVSQYGRVWVRDNDKSYLGQVTLVSAPEPGQSATPGDGVHSLNRRGGFGPSPNQGQLSLTHRLLSRQLRLAEFPKGFFTVVETAQP